MWSKIDGVDKILVSRAIQVQKAFKENLQNKSQKPNEDFDLYGIIVVALKRIEEEEGFLKIWV